MTERDENAVKLQVAGAQQQDVGKGTARLGNNAFSELGLRQGQVVEIAGQRTTAAIALLPYPADEGLPIVRIDGLIRANANVRMGDHVNVRPADVKPAQKVVLAPAQQNIQLKGSGRALLQTLHRRPLVAGDVVSTSVYRRTPGMDQNLFPEEIFRDFFERALAESRPSVTSETIEEYKRIQEVLKQERPLRRRIGFTAAREE